MADGTENNPEQEQEMVTIPQAKLDQLLDFGEKYKKLSVEYKEDLEKLIDNIGGVILDINRKGMDQFISDFAMSAMSGNGTGIKGLNPDVVIEVVSKYRPENA